MLMKYSFLYALLSQCTDAIYGINHRKKIISSSNTTFNFCLLLTSIFILESCSVNTAKDMPISPYNKKELNKTSKTQALPSQQSSPKKTIKISNTHVANMSDAEKHLLIIKLKKQIKKASAEKARTNKAIELKHQNLDDLLASYTKMHPMARSLTRDIAVLTQRKMQLTKEIKNDRAQIEAQSTPVTTTTHIPVPIKTTKRHKPLVPWTPKILAPSSTEYLPDFSYAGYHWGEVPLPKFQGKTFLVTQYGAVANDGIDDTDAILRAISAAYNHPGPVVVLFPKGRFQISQILPINRGHFVLRGAGRTGKNRTVLFFPSPILNVDLHPDLIKQQQKLKAGNKRVNGKPVSPAAWTGGFIWTEKKSKNNRFITQVNKGKRGRHKLTVLNAQHIKPGMNITIKWCNSGCNAGSLLSHILDNQPIHIVRELRKAQVTQAVTVLKVEGNVLHIKEQLLHNINPSWKVTLQTAHYLKEVGIEDFVIQFPKSTYRGHLQEAGFNGIYLTDLLHSWVKNITIINADSGIIVSKSKNTTLYNISIGGRGGHHSIVLYSSSTLVKKFEVLSKSYHGPTMAWASTHNIYTDGTILGGRLDQHGGLNHQNLYDNLRIRMDNIGRLFDHGGGSPTAGAFSTFWNISIDFNRHSQLKINDAPSARLVGIYGSKPIKLQYGPNVYKEGINKPGITVPSLYEFQLEQRLKAR